MTKRVLPHDKDAEQSVLGAVMLDNAAMVDMDVQLKPEMFYFARNESLWRTMLRMHQNGEPIDLVTLGSELEDRDQMDSIGGHSYLSEIANAVPSTANVNAYAKRVYACHKRRQLIKASYYTMQKAMDPDDMRVDELIADAEGRVYEIGQTEQTARLEPAGSLVFEHWESLFASRDQRGKMTGLPTGFPKLDRDLGGLQDGWLYLIAARPSMGKTALMLRIIEHLVDREHRVGLFSLEMPIEDVSQRLVCSMSRLPSQKVRNRLLNKEEWQQAMKVAQEIAAWPIFMTDQPMLTTWQVWSIARRAYARENIDIFFIDQFQEFADDASEQEEIKAMVRRIRAIAKELRVPVVLLHQLNRKPDRRKDTRPQLSDLRGSGHFEQLSDAVLFVHRENYYDGSADQRKAELILAKQRNGPTGFYGARWFEKYARFEELSWRGG